MKYDTKDREELFGDVPGPAPDEEAASRVAQLREEASMHVKEHEHESERYGMLANQHERAANWWRQIRDSDDQGPVAVNAEGTVRGRREV